MITYEAMRMLMDKYRRTIQLWLVGGGRSDVSPTHTLQEAQFIDKQSIFTSCGWMYSVCRNVPCNLKLVSGKPWLERLSARAQALQAFKPGFQNISPHWAV
jgi:hypothetical protein